MADAMADTPSHVSDELYAELRRHFSEEQLIELAASAAQENFRARYNRVFDVGSDGLYRKGCGSSSGEPRIQLSKGTTSLRTDSCGPSPNVAGPIGLDTHTRQHAIIPGHSEVDLPTCRLLLPFSQGLGYPCGARSGRFDVAAQSEVKTDGRKRAATLLPGKTKASRAEFFCK